MRDKIELEIKLTGNVPITILEIPFYSMSDNTITGIHDMFVKEIPGTLYVNYDCYQRLPDDTFYTQSLLMPKR